MVALNIQITDEQAARLADLRKKTGANISAFVRLAISARLNRAVVEAEQTPKIEHRATRVLVAPTAEGEKGNGNE